MASSSKRNYFSGLSRNTVLLAFASLFSDISTEMLYPVLPVFLTQTLKAGGSVVGIVEGVATATQNIIQGFSGWFSDRFQKRKSIALVGYLFAALSKPLLGTAIVWQGVLGARFLDRLGSGIRSAPRDALLASSVADKDRGKAFGLEGAGDNLGAFIGPMVAIVLLFVFHIDLRLIFFLAFIPGLLAFLMVLLVKEKPISVESKTKIETNFKRFPAPYWKYLAVTGLFGLGNSANSFLILQTRSLGVSLEVTIAIYALFNLVAALASYPSGYLSDTLGRKSMLLLSFVVFVLTYVGFALSRSVWVIGLLFVFYGLYQGIFRSVGKAFAIDFVPYHLRASGVGWYSTVVGLSGLFASIVAGQLWDKVSHSAVFLFGAAFAVAGSLAMLLFVSGKKQVKLQ